MRSVDLAGLRRMGERAALACGTELVHVELVGTDKQRILRFYIDKEGGVCLDDCTRVSELVSTYLEVEDPIDGRYFLEVSSPGVDRPLFSTTDYDRFKGRKAELRVSPAVDGRKVVRGTLLGVDGSTVMFEDERAGRMEIPFDRVVKGNLVGEVDFKREKRSGGGKRHRHAGDPGPREIE